MFNAVADWFILAVIVVIAVFDIWLVIDKRSTISRRMRKLGSELSAAPFAWGVLGGHFWGPDRPPMFGNWYLSIGLLLGSVVFVSLIHAGVKRCVNDDMPSGLSLAYVPAGIVAGIFFWPQ